MPSIVEKYWIYFALALLLIRVSSGIGSIIAFVVLVLMALSGGKNIIYSLFLSWLFFLINPVISSSSSLISIARLLIIFSATFSVFIMFMYKKNFTITKPQLLTTLLFILVLIHSFLFSIHPNVSFLKIAIWFLTFLVLLSSWQNLDRVDHNLVFNNIVSLMKVLLLISLPLIFIPSIGFARNGTGFQGIFNHPQVLGPTSALLGVIIASKALISSKFEPKELFYIALSFILIILSEARTAGVAFIFPLFTIIVLNMLKAKSKENRINFLKNKSNILVVVIVLIIFGSTFQIYSAYLADYLFKRVENGGSLVQLAEASRGSLVEIMMENIRSSPFTGIGLGIASIPNEMIIELDPLFGLPISAPVEKGVLFIAIVEELGIILSSIFYLWLIYILLRAYNYGLQNLSIVLCILASNLGENTFFSAGGLGLLFLIFLTFSIFNKGNLGVTKC